ncbi:four helix bundle protein [Elizabethkingia anophelis]|uniref:four helix bundle protein n=1 Tax=Elizabethkingia anophelis TaxID=1117645 RepID=UPI0020112325|nr:four helix bundle protein [Elizabethkingia anophelis]MCL1689402.1 four helix bundle protein [Elizabethkingia anophelis]MDV4009468.1 four helix bundle protein [Elizabethkingia anophelis]
MALYDQLPVYKEGYDLLLELYRISKNMDRDYKFTLGEKIKSAASDLIISIYRANRRENKLLILEEAKSHIEIIRLMLRIYKDLKQISVNDFINIPERIESTSKQINS